MNSRINPPTQPHSEVNIDHFEDPCCTSHHQCSHLLCTLRDISCIHFISQFIHTITRPTKFISRCFFFIFGTFSAFITQVWQHCSSYRNYAWSTQPDLVQSETYFISNGNSSLNFLLVKQSETSVPIFLPVTFENRNVNKLTPIIRQKTRGKAHIKTCTYTQISFHRSFELPNSLTRCQSAQK